MENTLGRIDSNNKNQNILRKLSTVLVLGTYLGLTACGAPQQQNQADSVDFSEANLSSIIGGTSVTANDPIAASTVGLLMVVDDPFMGSGVATCTGVLIDADLVLTAGHCAHQAKAVYASFGLKDPNKLFKNPDSLITNPNPQLPANVLRVKVAAVNPQYVNTGSQQSSANDKDSGDIALLKLEKPAPTGFKPVALLKDTALLKNGMPVVIAGYGLMKTLPNRMPASLQKTSIVLSDANYSSTEVLFRQFKGKGACHGDSGGPAFMSNNGQLTVFGITSRSATDTGAESCAEGSIYTNVAAWKTWVEQTAQKLKSLK